LAAANGPPGENKYPTDLATTNLLALRPAGDRTAVGSGRLGIEKQEYAMNSGSSAKPVKLIARATIVAGTLDILSAFFYASPEGHGPLVVLIGVASAVWPGARHAGATGAIAGLLLHFFIMLIMASIFVLVAARIRWTRRQPLIAGLLYGLSLWAVMNLVVLPLRWPTLFPHFTALGLAEQLFSHLVLVGIPIAWIARRSVDLLQDVH
jgi:hypothetical protein